MSKENLAKASTGRTSRSVSTGAATAAVWLFVLVVLVADECRTVLFAQTGGIMNMVSFGYETGRNALGKRVPRKLVIIGTRTSTSGGIRICCNSRPK